MVYGALIICSVLFLFSSLLPSALFCLVFFFFLACNGRCGTPGVCLRAALKHSSPATNPLSVLLSGTPVCCLHARVGAPCAVLFADSLILHSSQPVLGKNEGGGISSCAYHSTFCARRLRTFRRLAATCHYYMLLCLFLLVSTNGKLLYRTTFLPALSRFTFCPRTFSHVARWTGSAYAAFPAYGDHPGRIFALCISFLLCCARCLVACFSFFLSAFYLYMPGRRGEGGEGGLRTGEGGREPPLPASSASISSSASLSLSFLMPTRLKVPCLPLAWRTSRKGKDSLLSHVYVPSCTFTSAPPLPHSTCAPHASIHLSISIYLVPGAPHAPRPSSTFKTPPLTIGLSDLHLSSSIIYAYRVTSCGNAFAARGMRVPSRQTPAFWRRRRATRAFAARLDGFACALW